VNWTWVRKDVVLALHERQLAEHGGPAGVRDEGGLESALARAPNLDAYGRPDAAALAAAYAAGIARNHPFVDGNKRTAWVVARLFLELNDVNLVYQDAAAIQAMLRLAAGELTEDALARWFRERVKQP
jgi:death on curing protein